MHYQEVKRNPQENVPIAVNKNPLQRNNGPFTIYICMKESILQ